MQTQAVNKRRAARASTLEALEVNQGKPYLEPFAERAAVKRVHLDTSM